MKFLHRVKNYPSKIERPKISNEVEQDKEIVSGILQEIGQIVNSKRYFTEVVENQTVKLLDGLSVKEPVIAKKVFDELQVKYPDLVKHYIFKEKTSSA